jgi:phosphoenolpyruvate carboxylase
MDSAAISSLIAAGAALAGGTISQAFSLLGKRSERKHEVHLLRRAKLEELADLLHQSQVLVLQQLDGLAGKAPGKVSAVPVQSSLDEAALRVCSLSLLFFPALKDLADEFLKASVGLETAFDSGKEDGIIAAAQKMTLARKALETEIERCAVRLGFHGR